MKTLVIVLFFFVTTSIHSAHAEDSSFSHIVNEAFNGNPIAQTQLGILYLNKNTPYNENKAYYWLYMAAQKNHAPAQYYLGLLQVNSEVKGIHDYKRSYYWLAKAEQNGFEKSTEAMRVMEEFGKISKQDKENILSSIRKKSYLS